MKKLFRPYLAAFLLGSLLFTTACSDDDPEPVEEGEMITSMTISLVSQGKAPQPVTTTYSDIDGPGGNAPVVGPLNLTAGTTYDAVITFSDDRSGGAGDITPEIRQEGVDHEVFFVANPTTLLSTTKTDTDANGRPIGLTATVTTTNAGTGTLTVTLKHQPGLKGATSDANKGETDVQATFPVTIQ
ncbi:hypothetical protein GCM10028895_32260 [Pontibacter rugosus]